MSLHFASCNAHAHCHCVKPTPKLLLSTTEDATLNHFGRLQFVTSGWVSCKSSVDDGYQPAPVGFPWARALPAQRRKDDGRLQATRTRLFQCSRSVVLPRYTVCGQTASRCPALTALSKNVELCRAFDTQILSSLSVYTRYPTVPIQC